MRNASRAGRAREVKTKKAVFLYSLYTLRQRRGASPLLLIIGVRKGEQGRTLLTLDLGDLALRLHGVQQGCCLLAGGQFQSLPVMQTAGAQVQKEREGKGFWTQEPKCSS